MIFIFKFQKQREGRDVFGSLADGGGWATNAIGTNCAFDKLMLNKSWNKANKN